MDAYGLKLPRYLRLVVPVFSFLYVWLFGDVQPSLFCRGADVVVLLIAQFVSKLPFPRQIRADDNMLMPIEKNLWVGPVGRVKKVNAVLRVFAMCFTYPSLHQSLHFLKVINKIPLEIQWVYGQVPNIPLQVLIICPHSGSMGETGIMIGLLREEPAVPQKNIEDFSDMLAFPRSSPFFDKKQTTV
jgi:hypothetical protein